MIIGTGMIAKAFSDYNENANVLIYAKGVSNSQEKDELNFKRESDILKSVLDTNKEKIIIYFSTCSIYDPESKNTPYVLHKLKMEKLIQASNLQYYIFRLPQVVGKTTSPTLINFLSTKIKNGETFDVWKNAARNLIDVDDVYKISDYIIKNELSKNSIINIASELTTSIVEIVKKIEAKLKKKALYHEVDKGVTYHIDISIIKEHLKPIGVLMHGEYVDDIINKYTKT